MKSSKLFALAAVVVSLGGASILWAADAAQDRENAKLRAELQKLLAERVESSARCAKYQTGAYNSGTVTLDQMIEAMTNLADDRLAAATTAEERISALEAFVDQARTAEDKIGALFRTGSRGGEANSYAFIQRTRQTAEIRLLQEKLRDAED